MLEPAHLLRSEKLANRLSENPVLLTSIVACIWIFSGLVGHDPWKSEEAILTGQLFLLKASTGGFPFNAIFSGEVNNYPIFSWISLSIETLTSSVLPFHDGVRLSMGIWLLLTTLFVSRASDELWGKNASWIAPLILIGSVGLLVKGHQLSATTPFLAAMSIGLYGLAIAPRRSIVGGIWLGMAVISTPLLSQIEYLVLLVMITLAMVTVSPRYRSRRFGVTILTALFVALLSLAAFVALLLGIGGSQTLSYWIYLQGEGLTDIFVPAASRDYTYLLRSFLWFCWPGWIFCIWSLWSEGKTGLEKKEVQLPLISLVVTILFLCVRGSNSEIENSLVLLPIALLASIAVTRLPRGIGNSFYWFSIMSGIAFVFIAWVYFSASYFGAPTRLFEHLSKLHPLYVSQDHTWKILAATAVGIIWIGILFNIKRIPGRPILVWALTFTMGWLTASILLVSWIDSRKTYGPMIRDMVKNISAEHSCVLTQVGPAQQGLIEYFGRLKTSSIYPDDASNKCDYLIVQDSWDSGNTIGSPWTIVWEGGRSGDKRERFQLFRKQESRP
jgi:hypothetical protein